MSIFSLLVTQQSRRVSSARRRDAFARASASVIDQLDTGKFVLAYGDVTNGIAVLYTVPPGRTFYLVGYDVNTSPVNVAVAIAADLYYCDPGAVNQWNMCNQEGAVGCLNIHDSMPLPYISIPSGWSFRIYGDVNSHVYATVSGVIV